PPGASVGSASPRRTAQLLRVRPDLDVRMIRGNVETRLNKVVQQGQFDATLLAMAGLARLGLDDYAHSPLNMDLMLPAAGQGALAVQCRANDHDTIRQCLPLNDATSAAVVHGERQVVAALRGDCHSPIAVLLEPIGEQIRLRTRVLSSDGRQCIDDDQRAPLEQLHQLVSRGVEALVAAGADQLLHGS
ncbi:MAG: hydroxymethylbilane synthase, partial [Pirellulaceae bacterium]|nr:hydroxymethylbilane synthase [Pirellulaceae bacterium]